MPKRNRFYIFILLLVLVSVFVFGYFFRDGLVFVLLGGIGEPQKGKIAVHLYNNEDVDISDVLVRVYYVATSDTQGALDDWQEALSNVMQKVTAFFELQFGYELKLASRIYPQMIRISQSAGYFANLVKEDYTREIAQSHSPSLAVMSIIDAVRDKMEGKEDWDLAIQRLNNSYVVNLFVLTVDVDNLKAKDVTVLGLNDESNNSVVFSSGFTKEWSQGFYESVVGHEVGHGLGIPRFYSYTSDEVQTSEIMGGGLTRRLEDNYLKQEIKEKMLKR